MNVKRICYLSLLVVVLLVFATSSAWAYAPTMNYVTHIDRDTPNTNHPAGSLADWSPPTNLSDWQDAIVETRLELGQDGTQVAFWIRENSAGTQWSLWARVREPGKDWSDEYNLSGWLQPLSSTDAPFWGAAVTPDGTVWAMWAAIDSSVVGDNRFVRAAYRPKGGNWQNDDVSDPGMPAVYLRDAKLSMSRDGGLVAAWIECSKLTPLEDGPCALQVRRRFPGAATWEPVERIDDAWGNTGMADVWPLAGPGGIAVVLWEETNTLNSSEWGVMARAFDPGSGAWSSQYAPPISGWVSSIWFGLQQPGMGLDGTVVAAWLAWFPALTGNPVFYSATRPISSGVWNSPARISADRGGMMTYFGDFKLAVGEDGTVVAAWEYYDSSPELYVNVRDPGSTWGASDTKLANICSDFGLGVWPNGDALVVWGDVDYSRPVASNTRPYWSMRAPGGSWGAAGHGQLGDWTSDIFELALGLGHDHSAALAWSVFDSARPTGQQYGIYASTWPPGSSWEAPTNISDWFATSANIDQHGLVVGLDGQPLAAIWKAVRTGSPGEAVFYSGVGGGSSPGGHNIYLPLTVR